MSSGSFPEGVNAPFRWPQPSFIIAAQQIFAMDPKNERSYRPALLPEPSEEEIRRCAFQLYEQSGCRPGHDVADWLEASAGLKNSIYARWCQAVDSPEGGEAPALGDQAGRLAHCWRMAHARA
jgi:hypothetical protein